MKLRALIVDDERLARVRLRRMLEKHAEIEIIGEAENGAAAVEAIRTAAPAVVFLDVQMPGMNGFDVLDALEPGAEPIVVFVTAYDQHAISAFETCAIDYLLKPVAPPRLTKALARVREYHELRAAKAQAVPPAPAGQRFAVRSGQQTSFVAPDEIDWIEADGNYAILHLAERHHLLRETMSALEGQLPPQFFQRISRSAIVNLRRVRELQSDRSGRHFAVMQNGTRVPLTIRVRDLQERLRALPPSKIG